MRQLLEVRPFIRCGHLMWVWRGEWVRVRCSEWATYVIQGQQARYRCERHTKRRA